MVKFYLSVALALLISCNQHQTNKKEDIIKDYREFVDIVETQVLSGHASRWDEIYHIQSILKRDIQANLENVDSKKIGEIKRLDKRLKLIHKKWRKLSKANATLSFDSGEKTLWSTKTDIVMRTEY